MNNKNVLLEILLRRLSAEQGAWLKNAMDHGARGGDFSTTLANYTAATRRMGKVALQLTDEERSTFHEYRPGLVIDHWGTDECARALILMSCYEHGADAYAVLVQQAYDLGDSREQQSWLRALAVLPDSKRFLQTAIDSCRTNIVPLFESIACENPYPADFFPELNFNQMVMKCLFNQIPLARVVGLSSRMNSELSRMASQYAEERHAAGRTVPKDVHLVQAI